MWLGNQIPWGYYHCLPTSPPPHPPSDHHHHLKAIIVALLRPKACLWKKTGHIPGDSVFPHPAPAADLKKFRFWYSDLMKSMFVRFKFMEHTASSPVLLLKEEKEKRRKEKRKKEKERKYSPHPHPSSSWTREEKKGEKKKEKKEKERKNSPRLPPSSSWRREEKRCLGCPRPWFRCGVQNTDFDINKNI